MKKNTLKPPLPDLLLREIAGKSEDLPKANAAFQIFFHQFMPYVLGESVFMYKDKNIQEAGIDEEIAGNVLYTVWEKAHQFKIDEDVTPEIATKKVRAWLKKIVFTEYGMYFRETTKKDKIPIEFLVKYTDYEWMNNHDSDDYGENEATTADNYLEITFLAKDDRDDDLDLPMSNKYAWVFPIVKRVLAKIPEKHKEVFEIYLKNMNSEGRLPEGMKNEICVRYGMHNDYPRKIKQRVLKDIQTEVNKEIERMMDQSATDEPEEFSRKCS